jgi:hypothetical protein
MENQDPMHEADAAIAEQTQRELKDFGAIDVLNKALAGCKLER